MDTTSVAYVLCRIEDDASLTPVSGHQDIVDGVAAGKHQVEVSPPDRADGADDVLDVPFLPLLTTCENQLAKYEVGGRSRKVRG